MVSITYKNKAGKRVTVPYHVGKILHQKILKNIIHDTELPLDIFL